MKIKIMTAIYSDLNGSELGGREGRKDHYRFSLLSLLKMNNADFVCYTSSREVDDLKTFFYDINQIPKERLNFVIKELNECLYSEIINSVKDVEKMKKSDRCYEIQYSKFSWYNNEDETYDYYFWFDAGLSHCGIIPNKYLNGPGYRIYYESNLFNDQFLNNLINFCGDKFVVIAKENDRNYWESTVDPKYYTNYDRSLHVIGGMFGGKKENWRKIVDKFDEYVNMILPEQGRLFFEEHFMSLMFQNHKDWFNPLYFDVWWHEDNFKNRPESFFIENKSFYKILEELNG